MTEFRIAHQLVANGRKKFLIPLLYEDVRPDELNEVDADLKLYIQTHTYAECKNMVGVEIMAGLGDWGNFVFLGKFFKNVRRFFSG